MEQTAAILILIDLVSVEFLTALRTVNCIVVFKQHTNYLIHPLGRTAY